MRTGSLFEFFFCISSWLCDFVWSIGKFLKDDRWNPCLRNCIDRDKKNITTCNSLFVSCQDIFSDFLSVTNRNVATQKNVASRNLAASAHHCTSKMFFLTNKFKKKGYYDDLKTDQCQVHRGGQMSRNVQHHSGIPQNDQRPSPGTNSSNQYRSQSDYTGQNGLGRPMMRPSSTSISPTDYSNHSQVHSVQHNHPGYGAHARRSMSNPINGSQLEVQTHHGPKMDQQASIKSGICNLF